MMEYMIQKSLGVELSDPRVRAQMNLLVEYVDEDGSGDISFSEFVVLFLSVVVAAPKVKKLSNLNVALTPAAEIANLKKMFDEMAAHQTELNICKAKPIMIIGATSFLRHGAQRKRNMSAKR